MRSWMGWPNSYAARKCGGSQTLMGLGVGSLNLKGVTSNFVGRERESFTILISSQTFFLKSIQIEKVVIKYNHVFFSFLNKDQETWNRKHEIRNKNVIKLISVKYFHYCCV